MSRAIAAAAAAAFLLAAPAHSQDLSRVDSIFRFATPATPGCAVGVARNGELLVNRAYGLARVESGVPLTTRSKFDIGSTHKQFVAAAVLLLVEDGRLALTDDIRRYLPELPDYGHVITVDHLLTHTSGIRDWTGLLPLAEEGADVLELILKQRGLNFTPGEQWLYSNSGYVLAKEIVARVSGLSFAEFTRRRIFEPLGMTSSEYVSDILQGSGEIALAYQKEGAGWKQYMRLGNERGGGGVISTAGDLLLWNDALVHGRLGEFVTTKLEERARLNNGRRLTYARGLMVHDLPGATMIAHSGGAAGYGTGLARFMEAGVSVAVLCNFEPISATSLGGQVADLFLPPVDPQSQPSGPRAAPGVDVTGRAGLFFDQAGEPLRLAANNGRLAVVNGPQLIPVSVDRFLPPRPSQFFRSEDAFELTFRSDDEFEIRSMEGAVTLYRRALPFTPDVADVQAVEGRYHSEDLGPVIEIAGSARGIVFRLESAPDKTVEMEAVAHDTYMVSMMVVRFQRDAAGRVTGFVYSNPVAKNISFTRLGAGALGAMRGNGNERTPAQVR